ncbi:MAG: orotidine-5'-phosphate decarboxylase [Thermoplasmata archaeon]
MKIERGLVLALEVAERRRALKVAEEVEPFTDAVKVGLPVLLSSGLDIVRNLSKRTYVLCDLKLADIPNTNRLSAACVFAAGADGVIAHAFPGRDSLLAVVEEARRHGGEVWAVTEMSHPGALELMAPVAREMVRIAVETGAAGIVAPATRPDRLKALKSIAGSLKIIAPGVGAQGGSATAAILAGADAVIVGRSIYESPEPGRVARELAEETARALKSRGGGD